MLSKGMIMTIVGITGIIATITTFLIVYISTSNKIKAFVNEGTKDVNIKI